MAGLLALMLLTDARRAARTRPDGALVPLAEQDRGRWDEELIAEGVGLITGALPRGRSGPYQLQAAIAAMHDEAPRDRTPTGRRSSASTSLLERLAPNPMATLNRAVAVAEVHGPRAGLAALAPLEPDPMGAAPPLLRHPRAPARAGRRSRPRGLTTAPPPAARPVFPNASTWSLRPAGSPPKRARGPGRR